jgi:hypothetical protein
MRCVPVVMRVGCPVNRRVVGSSPTRGAPTAWLTIEVAGLHYGAVAEYATVTAALAMLASSLTGAFGSILPATDTKATSMVAAVARSHHVSGPQARGVYAKAPYRRPALRYLYTVGWLSAASDLNRCKAAQVLGPDPVVGAAQALRASPKTLGLLRTAHLRVSQAAAAIGRGTTDGCA